jgi:hypothetical protein
VGSDKRRQFSEQAVVRRLVLILDAVIVLLVLAEFLEAVFHFDVWKAWIEETGLQLILIAVRAYAVWHAVHAMRKQR